MRGSHGWRVDKHTRIIADTPRNITCYIQSQELRPELITSWGNEVVSHYIRIEYCTIYDKNIYYNIIILYCYCVRNVLIIYFHYCFFVKTLGGYPTNNNPNLKFHATKRIIVSSFKQLKKHCTYINIILLSSWLNYGSLYT